MPTRPTLEQHVAGAAPRLVGRRKLSVVGCTLVHMTTLSTVPEWVRPPSRAVMRMEDFLLRLYGRTKSPETLGAWACLDWLASRDWAQNHRDAYARYLRELVDLAPNSAPAVNQPGRTIPAG